MKSKTKGLIVLLGFVVAIAVTAILITSVNRTTEITSQEFYNDYLYKHDVKADSLQISNDTWTFEGSSTQKKYVVYLYNTNNSDQEKLDNYNFGINLANALDSEAKAINADTTISASEKADALSALDARWEDYVTKTHALNIYIGGQTYSEWKEKGVEISSKEELDNLLRKEIYKQKDDMVQREIAEKLQDALYENTQIDIPEQGIEFEAQYQLNEYKYQAQQYGMQIETFVGMMGMKSVED